MINPTKADSNDAENTVTESTLSTPKRGKGRPAILRVCVVCHETKKTSLFPPPKIAAMPDRCIACSKLATAVRIATRPYAIAAAKEAAKAAKAEKAAHRQANQEVTQAATAERRAEVAEKRRIERLRDSPKVAWFRQDLEERAAVRSAMSQITEYFRATCTVRCECCYIEPATGQDSIGFKHWCSLCGWGIERTGRCLAHPGEIHYQGLPTEGITLPLELLATMRVPVAPVYPEEAPSGPAPSAPTVGE